LLRPRFWSLVAIVPSTVANICLTDSACFKAILLVATYANSQHAEISVGTRSPVWEAALIIDFPSATIGNRKASGSREKEHEKTIFVPFF